MNFRAILTLAQNGDIEKLASELESSDVSPSSIVNSKTGDGLIHVAARAGHVSCVQYLISHVGIHVDQKNYEFKTALHEAAQTGHTDVVKVLLSHGAEVDCLKRADWTPVMLAATKTGNTDTVQLLIQAGADLRVLNKDGWSALHVGVRTGDTDMVTMLLSHCPQCLETRSNNGRSVLHTACLAGHLEMVTMLLSHSPGMVNTQDSCGATPLMDAARAGHMDIVKLLMVTSDISLRDTLDRSVVDVAAQAGASDVIEYFSTAHNINVTQDSTILNAAREGHSQLIKYLITEGANVNCLDKFGRSPLFLAVSGQHAEAARELIEAGSDVDIEDVNGNKLADLARKPCVRELLSTVNSS